VLQGVGVKGEQSETGNVWSEMSLSYQISICTAAGEAGNLQAMTSEIDLRSF